MRRFLTTLLLPAAVPAPAAEPRQCRVRVEIWEIGNAAWATAMDSMESPGAWRQSLPDAPGRRLAGSAVLSFATGSAASVQSSRERIYPVEYVAGGGLPASEPSAPRDPATSVSLLDLFDGWLRAKAHKDFEVRDEGWHFEASCVEAPDGRHLLKIEVSESKLRDFVSFGFNPLAMPQAEFSRFSIRVARSVEAGRWAIVAAQSTPPGEDGKDSGSQRVVLVLSDFPP
jgi:hypothetical protein